MGAPLWSTTCRDRDIHGKVQKQAMKSNVASTPYRTPQAPCCKALLSMDQQWAKPIQGKMNQMGNHVT